MLPAMFTAGRMAMQALPYITALTGAVEGAKQGGLMGALTGGGLGYFGGKLGKKGVQAATTGAIGATPGLATEAGKNLFLAKAGLASVIPIGAAAIAAPVVGRLAGKLGGPAGAAASGAARSAASAVTGAIGLGQAATRQPGALTSPVYPEGSVPDISRYQYPGMIAQQDLLGPHQANLAYQKQLQDLENQNIMKLGNYQLLANDEVRRRDFQRNAAAAQLATNLATQSQLQLGAQRNAAAMAGQALSDVGATTRTQYNYL